MNTKSDNVDIKKLTAGLLQHVADADLDMQIYQAYTWKKATEEIPFLEKLKKNSPWLKDYSEGLDRFNSLGISSVELSFALAEVNVCWIRRVWRYICKTDIAKRYRFIKRSTKDLKGVINVKIAVKRKKIGTWKIETTAYDSTHILENTELPNIFSSKGENAARPESAGINRLIPARLRGSGEGDREISPHG